MSAPEAQAPTVFRHRLPIQIRFNDVDSYGHVNNNAYFAYYDLGKEDYLRHVLCQDFRSHEVVPVIANIQADFLHPVFYGDPIEVETAIVRLGHKSFTLKQRAINVKSGVEVCHCTTVMVFLNLRTQQSADIPADYRRSMSNFEQLNTEFVPTSSEMAPTNSKL